jgi:SAM-dependent methyltransferase
MSSTGERLLNLGGGGNVAPHWLTADIDPRSDVYVDLTKPLPFPSGSLDGIFLEEVIEHIPASNAASLAMECFRCLKPGKPIRISTPDLLWFFALFGLPPLNGPAAVRDFTAEILSTISPFAFLSGFICGRAGSVKGARSAAILIANP